MSSPSKFTFILVGSSLVGAQKKLFSKAGESNNVKKVKTKGDALECERITSIRSGDRGGWKIVTVP